MRISRTNELDTIVSELSIGEGGQVAGSVTDGDRLYLLTIRPEVLEIITEGGTNWVYKTTYTTHVVDIGQPDAPAILGTVGQTIEGLQYGSRLKGGILPGGELIWYPEEGGSAEISGGIPRWDIAPIRGDIWWPYYGSNSNQVIVTRMSDPAQPAVTVHLSLMEPAAGDANYRESGPSSSKPTPLPSDTSRAVGSKSATRMHITSSRST